MKAVLGFMENIFKKKKAFCDKIRINQKTIPKIELEINFT